MIRVGLTGGLSAGKTTAGQIFGEFGATVFDADRIVSDLYAPGAAGTREVERLFGKDLLDPRAGVKKKKLAKKIFSDSAARRKLEEAIHPLVLAETRRRFSLAESEGAAVAILEASQIFEGGYEREFDRVVLIVSPEIVRMKRWREDGLAPEELARRMAAQIVENEARRKADDIIVNAGTREELREKIKALYDRYRSLAEK